MSHTPNRRQFLGQSSAAVAGLAAIAAPAVAAEQSSKKLVCGFMGLGRGHDHVVAALTLPNAELAYLCDVDDKRIERAFKTVTAKQTKEPKTVKDFRRILDDKNVDCLFIAAPNFWHAPATILACAAGKHVYVEKPGSHNPLEAELMVEAARKHKRVVQMGTQRRSWPAIQEAMQKLKEGAIGKLLTARTYYTNTRPTIGKGMQTDVPPNIDYKMWQGPVPERPYVDNLVHYNWHWRWIYGGGELANNGIHALDLARWGLGVEGHPRRVTCGGGRYHFQDDQETPDTALATFDYGGKLITWESSSCHPRKSDKTPFVEFYGDQGNLVLDGSASYTIYDLKGKEVGKSTSPGGDPVHIGNFLDCITSGKTPNQDIAEGQKGTLLCHLGNISYRMGRTLNVDPQTGKIVGDKDAMALWRREYRQGWEPKV